MATLIDVATPRPALALYPGTQNTAITSLGLLTGPIPTLVGPSAPINLNSISLGAGTWAVIGVCLTTAADTPPTAIYLNTASAVASDSWPTQAQGTGGAGAVTPFAKGAVIKLTGTTTVYLNGYQTVYGSAYSMIYAVQIA